MHMQTTFYFFQRYFIDTKLWGLRVNVPFFLQNENCNCNAKSTYNYSSCPSSKLTYDISVCANYQPQPIIKHHALMNFLIMFGKTWMYAASLSLWVTFCVGFAVLMSTVS